MTLRPEFISPERPEDARCEPKSTARTGLNR